MTPSYRRRGIVVLFFCAQLFAATGIIAFITAAATSMNGDLGLAFDSDQLFHISLGLLALAILCKLKLALIKLRKLKNNILSTAGYGDRSCGEACDPSQCAGGGTCSPDGCASGNCCKK